MSILRPIGHLVWADFLERVRRYSFLIVLGLTALAGYSMVPGVGEPYSALLIGGCRGTYNAAWIGTTFGTVVVTLLTLLGFFVIRKAITRDYETRLGQIIAASRVSTLLYMIGKWLSNLAVLLVMLVVLTVLAFVMLWLRREGAGLDLRALVAPIWLMSLPALALVAALAVLFESVPFLRFGLGNFVFTGLWGWFLLCQVGPMFVSPGTVQPSNDLSGLSVTIVDLSRQMRETGLDPNEGVTDLYVPLEGGVPRTFEWTGVDWTLRMVFKRMLWVGVAALVVVLAVIPFDRFDPARTGSRVKKRRKPKSGKGVVSRMFERFAAADSKLAGAHDSVAVGRLTPFRSRGLPPGVWSLTLWELRLLLKGRNRWWYIGAVTIIGTSLFLPEAELARFLVPFAWIWPILVWSEMGSMEKRYRTWAIVYPTPRSHWVQLVPAWSAGVVIAGIMTSGAVTRSVIGGNFSQILGYAAGCLFVPALALGLGVVSGSGRLFEMIYAVLWLFGVFGMARPLDFLGRGHDAFGVGVPLYYVAIGILILAIAAAKRGQRVRSLSG